MQVHSFFLPSFQRMLVEYGNGVALGMTYTPPNYTWNVRGKIVILLWDCSVLVMTGVSALPGCGSWMLANSCPRLVAGVPYVPNTVNQINANTYSVVTSSNIGTGILTVRAAAPTLLQSALLALHLPALLLFCLLQPRHATSPCASQLTFFCDVQYNMMPNVGGIYFQSCGHIVIQNIALYASNGVAFGSIYSTAGITWR